MTKDDVLQALLRHRVQLHDVGIRHAAVFGSLARGDAGPDSDVDILVELAPASRTVFDLADIERAVTALFSGCVHVAVADQLKPSLRDRVLAQAAYAF